MPRRRQHTRMALTLLVSLGAGPAFASPPIRDEADLFKPETLRLAVREIEDLERQHGQKVRVETVRTYPADQARPGTFFGPQVPPDSFFTKWAEERARAAGDADLFVLVCREPPRVRVVVGPAAEGEFPRKASAGLRKLLEQRFDRKAPDYDQGLLDGLAFVRQTLDANLQPQGRQVNWTAIIGLLGCLLFVWLILSLLRSRPESAPKEERPVEEAVSATEPPAEEPVHPV